MFIKITVTLLIAYKVSLGSLVSWAAPPCFNDFTRKIVEEMNRKNIHGEEEWKKFSDAFEACERKQKSMNECFSPFINKRFEDPNFYKKFECIEVNSTQLCDYVDLKAGESKNWIEGFTTCIQKYSKNDCAGDDYKKFLIGEENVRNNFLKFCKIHNDDCTCDTNCEKLIKKTEIEFKKGYVKKNTAETEAFLQDDDVKDELKFLFEKLNRDKKLPPNYLNSNKLIGTGWREQIIGTLTECYADRKNKTGICSQMIGYVEQEIKGTRPKIKSEDIMNCLNNLRSKQAAHGCNSKLISVLGSFRDGGRTYGNKRNEAFGQGFPNKHGSANTSNPDPNSPYIELDVKFQLPTDINGHWGRGRNRVVYDSDSGAVFFTSDHYNTSHFLGCIKKFKGCDKNNIKKGIGKSNTVINDKILGLGKRLGLRTD